MVRQIITAAALMLITTSVAHAQDAKAKGILESASKKMSTYKTLKSAFTLKLLGAGGKVRDTKKGTFLMKGPKYRITLMGQEIICDGKTVWTYMKDAAEVQISNYNPNEQALSPAKLFTNFYDKEYSYRYVGSKKIGGKTCNVVELTPVSKSRQFTKVELAVDAGGTVTGGNIFEKNGAQYQYEVSGMKPNAALPDAQFSFDVKTYPGTEVVDLR